MSMLLAALMVIPLLAIAIAHFLWSIGRSWPIRDPELLPRTVIGMPGVTRVPRLPSLVVAVAIAIVCVLTLALADHTGGGTLLTVIGGLLALVFLGRGIVGYTPQWAARTPVEPFRTLDRKTYSPLCLALGAGFVILVVMRLI
jgi:hypothetical protein